MTLRELRGAVHVHSVLSDGSGTVEEIVEAARRRGLDFVVLTDDEPEACRPELAGRHGDLLLIVGAEIGSREVPHLLALGVDDPDRLDRGDVHRCLAGIRARRGRAFVAHPRGTSFLSLRMPPWTAWDSDDYVGMEVWSYMHDWIEDLRWWRLGSHVLWPERQITGPHPEVLAAWDRMTMRRHVSGIGAVDAHARPIVGLWFKVFPYEMLFGTVLSHVLVENGARDVADEMAAVVDALAGGRNFMAYHVAGDPTGFSFTAVSDTGETQMGGDVPLDENPVLRVSVPAEAETRLVICGVVEAERTGRDREFRVERRGPHRVEVRRGSKPWIFSNPIYVT